MPSGIGHCQPSGEPSRASEQHMRSERREWSNQTRIARRRTEEERAEALFLLRATTTAVASAARSARSECREWTNQTRGYWSERAEKSITSPTCLLLYGGA